MWGSVADCSRPEDTDWPREYGGRAPRFGKWEREGRWKRGRQLLKHSPLKSKENRTHS